MHPKFESQESRSHESDLFLLAKRYGFASAIPDANTEGYRRLRDTLLSFARLIASAEAPPVDTSAARYMSGERGRAQVKEILSSRIQEAEKKVTPFENRRRELHDELCRMMFGTAWQDTPRHRREQITDFAFQLRELEEPPQKAAA